MLLEGGEKVSGELNAVFAKGGLQKNGQKDRGDALPLCSLTQRSSIPIYFKKLFEKYLGVSHARRKVLRKTARDQGLSGTFRTAPNFNFKIMNWSF